jgi:hypothetical protein
LVIRKIGTGGNWRLRDTFATYQIVALVDIRTREVSIGLRLLYVQLFVRPCAILECYYLRCTLFGIEDKIAQWSRRRRRRRRRRPLARARFNIIGYSRPSLLSTRICRFSVAMAVVVGGRSDGLPIDCTVISAVRHRSAVFARLRRANTPTKKARCRQGLELYVSWSNVSVLRSSDAEAQRNITFRSTVSHRQYTTRIHDSDHR